MLLGNRTKSDASPLPSIKGYERHPFQACNDIMRDQVSNVPVWRQGNIAEEHNYCQQDNQRAVDALGLNRALCHTRGNRFQRVTSTCGAMCAANPCKG